MSMSEWGWYRYPSKHGVDDSEVTWAADAAHDTETHAPGSSAPDAEEQDAEYARFLGIIRPRPLVSTATGNRPPVDIG